MFKYILEAKVNKYHDKAVVSRETALQFLKDIKRRPDIYGEVFTVSVYLVSNPSIPKNNKKIIRRDVSIIQELTSGGYRKTSLYRKFECRVYEEFEYKNEHGLYRNKNKPFEDLRNILMRRNNIKQLDQLERGIK